MYITPCFTDSFYPVYLNLIRTFEIYNYDIKNEYLMSCEFLTVDEKVLEEYKIVSIFSEI